MSIASVLFGLGVGLLVGAVYFVGLWLTVRRAARSVRPAPWLLGSFTLRSLLALGAFLLVLKLASPVALVVALTGFMVARWLITRYLPTDRKVAGGTP